MNSKEFKDLVKISEDYILAAKRKKVNLNEILSGLYTDPSHFIYELIQNAEDAGATEIIFNLSNEKFEIIHNGRNFNFNDIEAIVGYGLSTKKDLNKIGKFGIGFKSVFAITKAPIIHSGNYHIRVDEFVIPSIINEVSTDKTIIILPFNHPTRSAENIFKIIDTKLNHINPITLLFLKNINKIKWQSPSKSGIYSKSVKTIPNIIHTKKISITSKVLQQMVSSNYLIIQKPIQIENNPHLVELAYRLSVDNDGNEKIIKEKNSKLNVFFPTSKVTFLNFLIQGPYKTIPNREDIPLDDYQNRLLIRETATLVAESITIIKKLNLLTSSFLEVIPINQSHDNEYIYYSIFKEVNDKLMSDEALIPTQNNKFTNANNAIIARGKDLTNILTSNDLEILFNKKNWVSTNITFDKARELRDYLINVLNIKEIEFKDFAFSINEKFISSKSDNWLINFYVISLKHRILWQKESKINKIGILRNRPIIRLYDNTNVSPYNEKNQLQVYLPSNSISNSECKIVKEDLTRNIDALEFLKNLGLTEPDYLVDIQTNILIKYTNARSDLNPNEYMKDFNFIFSCYKLLGSNRRKILKDLLSEYYIIYCKRLNSNITQYYKPSGAYITNDYLVEYFDNFSGVLFVADLIYEKFIGSSDELLDFLLFMGCNNCPKRIKIDGNLSIKERKSLRNNKNYTKDQLPIDYKLEGLTNFINNISVKRSKLLWDILITCVSNYDGSDKKNYFLGEYTWFHRKQNIIKFNSIFLHTLQSQKWLVNRNNDFIAPVNTNFSELTSLYSNDNNAKILINSLNFQFDEIKNIEEKYGGFYIPAEEKDIYLQWKALQENIRNDQNSDSNSNLFLETDPDNIFPIAEDFNPHVIEISDYRGQLPSEKNIKNQKKEISLNNDKETNKTSKKDLKHIGIWGEKFVYNYLKLKYKSDQNIKIVWQNTNNSIGHGYDFSILSNLREIEYIEVKSKTDNSQQFFLTGTQWQFANKLYNDNEGDKFKIYVVCNALTDDANIKIIKNPFKLWKEGRLYAHPIQIKL